MAMTATVSLGVVIASVSVGALSLNVRPLGSGSFQGRYELLAGQTTQLPSSPLLQSRPAVGPATNADYRWWKDAALVKELGLSDQQVARIDKIFDQREKDIDPFIKDLSEQRNKLEQMVTERLIDVPTLQLQLTRVDSLSARIHESRVVMLYRMSLVLTPDQFRKLQAVQNRTRGRRGGGPTIRQGAPNEKDYFSDR